MEIEHPTASDPQRVCQVNVCFIRATLIREGVMNRRTVCDGPFDVGDKLLKGDLGFVLVKGLKRKKNERAKNCRRGVDIDEGNMG